MKNLLPRSVIWSISLLVIVVLGLVALRYSYDLRDRILDKNPQNTLSVTAEGKVKAVPDLAEVSAGVLTNGDTADAVQGDNNKKVNAIIAFLKKQGVSANDIATSQFSMYPQQDYQSGKQVITGYQSNQVITFKVRNVDKSTDQLGKILGGITGAGANQINGVNLTFNDPDELRNQARQLAITKAGQKAQDLANVAGLRLGRVVNVMEAGTPYPLPYAAGMGMGAGIGGGGPAPDIQPGNQDIIENMTVVFEVQ